MAKANTTEWEHGGFVSVECDRCKKKDVRHRKFYYPIFMNGDAECLESLCDECYQKPLTPSPEE